MRKLYGAVALVVVAFLVFVIVQDVSSAQLGVSPEAPSTGMTISGVVRNSDGEPISGIVVEAYDPRTHKKVASAKTDANGFYKLELKSKGSYALRTYTKTGEYQDEWLGDLSVRDSSVSDASLVTVAQGGVVDANFVLLPGHSIAGAVTDEDSGLPITHGYVYAYDSIGNAAASSELAPDGSYSLLGLSPGEYRLRTLLTQHLDEWFDNVLADEWDWGGFREIPPPDGASPVDISESDAGDIDFVLDEGRVISGRVTPEDSGGSRVFDYIYAPGRVSAFDQTGNKVAEANIAADGRYAVYGLQPGEYRLRTLTAWLVDEWFDDLPVSTTGIETADPVSVTASDAVDVDFTLALGRSISGVVTDSSLQEGVEHGFVVACDAEGEEVKRAAVSGDGSYTITGLDPGSYRVHTEAAGGSELVDEWYDGVNGLSFWCHTAADGQPVDVPTDNADGVDFALDPPDRVVSGTVTDADTGLPVAMAWIYLCDDTGYRNRSAWTDENGAYEITELAPGAYKVRAGADGFYYEWWDDVPVDEDFVLADATPVLVCDGNAPETDFALTAYPVITGTVVREEGGEPVEGRVDLYRLYPEWGYWSQYNSAPIQTDGTYTLRAYSPGDYRVRTVNYEGRRDEWYDDVPAYAYDGYVGGSPLATTIPCVSGVTSGIDFALSPSEAEGYSISGRVVDETTGQPIATPSLVTLYNVRTYGWGYTWYAETASFWVDSDGSYVFYGVQPGVYVVKAESSAGGFVAKLWDDVEVIGESFDDADRIPVTGGDVTNVDFELRRGLSISGSVTDELTGGAFEGSWGYVQLYDATGDYIWDVSINNGAYRFDCLPPGSYYLATRSTYVDQWYDGVPQEESPDSGPPADATPVVLTTTSKNDIDFVLQPLRSIKGVVLDQATQEPLDLDFAPWDKYVFAYAADGTWTRGQISPWSGTFQLDGLLPGAYRLRTATGHVDEWYPDVTVQGHTMADGGLIDVTQGDVAGLRIELERGLSISGSVVNEVTGEGVGVGQVWVVDQDGSPVKKAESGSRYAVTGLLSGDYRIRTLTDFVDEWYDDLRADLHGVGEAEPVVLADSGADNVDFHLRPHLTNGVTRTIAGRVADVNGQPVSGHVEICDLGGNTLRSIWLQDDGSYRTSLLLPGEYLLRTAYTGMFDEWIGDLTVWDHELGDVVPLDLTDGDVLNADFTLAQYSPLDAALHTGWQLVAGAAGSDCGNVTMFAFGEGSYYSMPPDKLAAGCGYWVKPPQPVDATLNMVVGPVTVELETGWNLIGNATHRSVSLPEGLMGFAFENGGYVGTQVLEPGQGAWVKVGTPTWAFLEPVE